jgi:hypothetical protein
MSEPNVPIGFLGLAGAVLLLCLVLAAPPSSSYHLSAGTDSTVLVPSKEEAGEESVDEEAYRRGIRQDCEEAEPRIDPEEVREALFYDAFCGQLIYHEDTIMQAVSPPDQQFLHREIERFDVVPVERAPGLEPCAPWCMGWAGDLAWDGIHRAGQQAGLTHGPDDADELENEERRQKLGGTVRTPMATAVAQNELNAWEMNGWMTHSPTRSFVAFLEDNHANPLGPEALRNIAERADLANDEPPLVCGFTPSADFQSTDTRSACEITFQPVGASSGDDTRFDGYDDSCESPSYVCGFQGWKADVSCAGCGGTEQIDYYVWHWVLAPATSDCGGLREPGFQVADNGYFKPFLAHDLDVYTPVTAVSSTPTPSPSGISGYGGGMVDRAAEETGLSDVGTPPLPEGQEETVDEIVDGVANASYRFAKDHRVEPNAKPAGALADTSQAITLSREGNCELIETGETERTRDPWVNVVDGEALGAGAGTYGNDEAHQDDHNNPTAGTYTVQGKTGMFADKDDDGTYDQVASGEKYLADAITENGAYPMLWDVPVDAKSHTVDTDAGCTVQGTPLGEIAQRAGYGPNTGLVQAIYLNELTAFRDPASQTVVPYATGNNIYLMMSSAARDLYEPGGENDAPIAQEIEDLVTNVKSYVTFDLDREEPDVVIPGEDLETDAAFSGQCSEETGGFTSRLSFTHHCQRDCSGDTIATMYVFQAEDGTIGGGTVPTFPVDDAYWFGSGVHAWYDVDPFDGDPDRNREESSAPPTE